MSDIKPASERRLTEDQARGIEESSKWVQSALAELGSAYLEYEKAKSVMEKADAFLSQCRANAKHASKQYDQVLKVVASTMELSPGDWTYDSENSRLVNHG